MHEPTIKIETFPNQSGRGYHTTCELSNVHQLTLKRPFKSKARPERKRFAFLRKKQGLSYDDEKLLEAGTQCVRMCEALFVIEGVDHIYVKSYEISVYIGQAFKWCDVEPQILEVLKRRFVNPNDVTVVSPFDK